MIEFEKFFAGEFQRRLRDASVPHMPDASWDRKAAWLLFEAERKALNVPYPKPEIYTPQNAMGDVLRSLFD